MPRHLHLISPAATLVLLVAFLLALPGCGGSGDTSPQTPANGEATDDRSDWPEAIRFGILPIEGGADTTERFAPLEQVLGEELGIPVQVVSATSYQGVITAMANDQIEFAWLGPKSYVEAARRADAEAVLLELGADGSPGYRAIFLVPQESDIQTLEDARGKRFAFTDPNSTSGFLIPAIVLIDEVGEPADNFFGEVQFSGAHGTSVLQVAARELDIVATNDLDYQKILDRGSVAEGDLRIVHTSDLIPGSPLAVRRELPESLKQAFVQAMLKINDRPDLLERFQNGGFQECEDADFDIIRAAQDYLESHAE